MSTEVSILYVRKTGTSRVTGTTIEQDFHIVVNVQGAHPLLHEQIAKEAVYEFARRNELTVTATELLEHELIYPPVNNI
jgi:CMP-2-keto-3-deoxyoctulosonic acid synthetase